MKKVIVGMSGGVDSSVSALLLKQAGYEVIGATLKLDNENQDKDAKKVCDMLKIPHYTIEARKEFKDNVVKPFINCYLQGKTPNPCIECNKYIKFGLFFKKAIELGCDYIATGHYAKVEYCEIRKQYVLKKSAEEKKDQTYFLYGIPKEVLPKMLFPLEKINGKQEVRELAKKYNLPIANKPDSQEICFIPNKDYVSFLKNNVKIKQESGNICLKDGTVLGRHEGIINYTVGQRKGLGISYIYPLYVCKIKPDVNEIIVGSEKELYRTTLKANELNFLVKIDNTKPINIKAKIRYRAKEAEATLYLEEQGEARIVFKQPQRAITPGQAVVFYEGDVVIGGGKIL